MVTEGSGYKCLVTQQTKKEAKQQEATARQQVKGAKADKRLHDRQENATSRILEGPVSKTHLKEELEEIVYSLSILARTSVAANALRANCTKDIRLLRGFQNTYWKILTLSKTLALLTSFGQGVGELQSGLWWNLPWKHKRQKHLDSPLKSFHCKW